MRSKRPDRVRALGLLEGDRTASGPAPATAVRGYFPPPLRGFASRNKIAAPRRPPLTLRPLSLRSAVQTRSARRQVIATKAAMGAVNPAKDLFRDDRS